MPPVEVAAPDHQHLLGTERDPDRTPGSAAEVGGADAGDDQVVDGDLEVAPRAHREPAAAGLVPGELRAVQ